MKASIKERMAQIQPPEKMGSYSQADCIFLLKNINGLLAEQSNEEREAAIQSGTHYSEMLPVEYMPTEEYIDLYERTLQETASTIAYYTGVVAELIYKRKKGRPVLVSLARAGTPVGVLIKRYLQQKYGVSVPHYSLSIIRDKGIDENALLYILQDYAPEDLQFIDGWTGKGMIGKTLTAACKKFETDYGISLDDTLAVLCDPGECTVLYGTREDLLIPSACLNATVSGLMSRTFLREDLIGPYDFHGAKYYKEWEWADRSNEFVDTVSRYFKTLTMTEEDLKAREPARFMAASSVENIRKAFDIESINRVKPGIGETTRVLLRRLPWKILVRDPKDPHLKHILLLAEERGIPVMVYKEMCYACCGLIKKVHPQEKGEKK